MSGWRELARHLKGQEGAEEAPATFAPIVHSVPIVPIVPAAVSQFAHGVEPGLAAPIVPNVPIVPRAISHSVPLADPAAWLAALLAIDTSRPPAGIAPDLWPIVLDDARWIARVHGDNAAALGWSASDLFGLSDHVGEGGLAERLEGARRLAFTSSVAHWRGEECEGWLWRRTLTAKPVLWEA